LNTKVVWGKKAGNGRSIPSFSTSYNATWGKGEAGKEHPRGSGNFKGRETRKTVATPWGGAKLILDALLAWKEQGGMQKHNAPLSMEKGKAKMKIENPGTKESRRKKKKSRT